MVGIVALRSGIAEMQTALLVIGGGAGRSRLVAAAGEAAAVVGLNGSGLWQEVSWSTGRSGAAGPRVDVRRVGRAVVGRSFGMVARRAARS
jgi:hypothetical protein